MGIAACKCEKGHTWSTRLIADEPDVNACEVEGAQCPECGSEDFEITEVEDDWEE